ncbi:hypothetical protein B0A55_00853 [Friedmanniomyces simplex]|uniref:Uncharacterized protein n=1 Tax=Friedmanniomyces simplex TaxID=329884 RepID=A0A4U0Y1R0_9PEZI|nr:hypothetical protein B0A55_00853 [Friedmanniomyces simplex]
MGLGSAAHALTTSDTSPTKKARGAEPIAPDTTSIRKPSGMQELLSRRPLGDRSTNARIPRMNSLADAPHEIVSPPPKTLTARDPTLNAYNLAMQTPLPRAAEAGEVSLGEYATQSRQDREAVLEAFMMEKLEDPAFATLCEDVENCWRMRVLWGCDANTA